VSFNVLLYRIPADGAVPPKLYGFVLHFVILRVVDPFLFLWMVSTFLVTTVTVVSPTHIPVHDRLILMDVSVVPWFGIAQSE
jgi:hypothetical protein